MTSTAGRGWVLVCGLLGAALMAPGCSNRKSSLLYERQARGPLEEEREIALEQYWKLEPQTQTKTEHQVELMLIHADPAYLQNFFNNRAVFGQFAGKNPYFSEQIVFYLKIANKSGKKIGIDPNAMVVIDDRGNQYSFINPDYIHALAEAKQPVLTAARGVVDDARPGYFGFGVPVGKIFGKSQWRFALLKMATFQSGQLHDGVVYDGLISFWTPHEAAKALKLIVDVKTAYGPDDLPSESATMVFDVTASRVTK
jgi:hypothetical protein